MFSQMNQLMWCAAVLVVAGWVPSGNAAIVATKNSADFNTKNHEGNSVPSAISGDISDWTVDGSGNYFIQHDGVDGAAGSSGSLAAATGWTMEIRLKVIDTAATGDVLTIALGDGHNGHYTVLNIREGAIANAQGVSLRNYNFVDDFVTIRYAREGIGGEEKLWVDGVVTANPSHSAHTLNRQWFGDLGGGIGNDGKEVLVDYFRLDTTGAYAPGPVSVPEPAAGALLAAGMLCLIRGRRLR